MTRRDDEPQGPGGHAGERRRQFERARGLPEAHELDLPEPADPGADIDPDDGQDDGQHDGQDGARE
jgi:hypothetical protein